MSYRSILVHFDESARCEARVTPSATGLPNYLDLSRACDLDTDLPLMRGHGHSRVTEFLLGGVKRRLFARMTLPAIL